MAYLDDDRDLLYSRPDDSDEHPDPWASWTVSERADFLARVAPAPLDPTDRAVFIQDDEVPF